MSTGPTPIPAELLRAEAERIATRYRVGPDEALLALSEAFADEPELAARIRERHGREDVTRWRDYRRVVRQCRKELYYGLRRYYRRPKEADRLLAEWERATAQASDLGEVAELRDALLRAHTSTAERLPHAAEFHERLFELAGVPASVLDVGCGMHPLSYPFGGAGRGTALYAAVDRDARAIRAVRACAPLVRPTRLEAARVRLEEPGWPASLPWDGPFALCLMLKVVPVLSRLEREALDTMRSVPAKRVLVTGSTQAMTRREEIERRERAVLERFIAESGRPVLGELRAGTEFGYLLG